MIKHLKNYDQTRISDYQKQLFYDNIVYKKNNYGWTFKEDLSFFKAKILNLNKSNLKLSKGGGVVE